MKHLIRSAPIVLTLGSGVVACTGESSTDDTSSTLEHDCTPYEAATVTQTFTGQWTDANDNRSVDYAAPHAFTAPDEPGGGWVEIELTATSTIGNQFSPVARARAGEREVASALGGFRGQSVLRLAAAPGQTYALAATQHQPDILSENYPINYEMVVTYTGAMDCYEPNRERSDARAIPLDQSIEAFMTAGLHEDLPASVTTPLTTDYADWFKIRLDRRTIVHLDIEQLPENLGIVATIFPEGGVAVALTAGEDRSPGAPFISSEVELGAGTYEIYLRPQGLLPASTRSPEDDPLPHWVEPYQFKVSTR